MNHPKVTTSVVRLREFEPEQLLEVVSGARLEHYILGQAKCSAHLSRWSCGDFSVDIGDYDFPVRAVGGFSPDRLCLGYMRKMRKSTWVNGLHAELDTVEIYPESSEMNYRCAPGGEWVATEFSREAFHRAARERLGFEMDLPRNHIVSYRVSAIGRATLDEMIQKLWLHPASGALMMTSILETLAVLISEAHGEPMPESRLSLVKRRALLARAEKHINANAAKPFDLQSLVSSSGATARTLQREFMTAYGMSPHEWARCVMLHMARKRLRANGARKFTVEAIAHECGFRHMGRFAKYYLQLFGEHPSRTFSKQSFLERPERK